MPRGFPTPPETIARIRELRAQGFELKGIAEDVGLSISTVGQLASETAAKKQAQRRERYRGTCGWPGCERRTDGSDGPSAPAEYCREHTVEVRRQWSQETIIAAIKDWHAKHGSPPTSTVWSQECGPYPRVKTVQANFGSFSAALRAAGFEPHAKSTGPLGDGHPVIREMLSLHRDGLTPAEIAERQGVSREAIVTRMRRRYITPNKAHRRWARAEKAAPVTKETLRCGECDGEWTRWPVSGPKPSRCPTCKRRPEEQREARRTAAQLARDAARERRAELRRDAQERKRVERAIDVLAAAPVKSVRDSFAPLVEDEDARLIAEDIVEVVRRSLVLRGAATKATLTRAIKAYANAVGVDGVREAAYDLAATALALAAQVPPGTMRETDPEESLAA